MAIKAAIDVGSNSIKLLVADVAADGSYRVLQNDSEITGMASGLKAGGQLDPGARQRTLACLTRFVHCANQLGASTIAAAGTSALRDAGDSKEFLAQVKQELNLDVRVLSGEDEARLSRAVALRELPPGEPDLLFFDVGGGSTELTLLHDAVVRAQKSLQLGARRATDTAAVVQPVTAEAHAAVVRFIQGLLAQDAPTVPAGTQLRIAGLGGTATTAVKMLAGQRGEGEIDPNRAQVTLAELDALLAAIAPLTLDELKQWPNLNPERAPVIYAGISIVAELLRHYAVAGLTVVDRGLRYGLLLAGG